MNISKIKITKNIDSILHVTNDVIHKNNNYHDYIKKENNSLYLRQLPLLMKNERMKALISKKLDDSQKNLSLLLLDEEKQSKESSEKLKFNLLSPLNNIRKLKVRSKKLPPLCPLYNKQGELIPSVIKSSKVFYRKINYNDFLNRINSGLIEFPNNSNNNNKKLTFRKLEIKKIHQVKSCVNLDIKIKLDDIENNYFKKQEYQHLEYNEEKIFGEDNIKSYEELIKNKIIELQTVHNKNDTIKKEKEYIYGFDKRKIILTLDSLKVKFFEIKDEKNINIEKKSDKPCFEYILPFALLPLFYFKGIQNFLIILSKIIIFNEKTMTFELDEKSNEIIATILKNCSDFYMSNDGDNFNSNENDWNLNESNDLNNSELKTVSGKNTTTQKLNNKSIVELNPEIKGTNLNTQFINAQTSNQNNTSEINNKSTTDQNNLNTKDNNTLNNNNNNPINPTNSINQNQESNLQNDIIKQTFTFSSRKSRIVKTHDIFALKKNTNEKKIISQYEFFWITPKKSFILSVEIPLISIFAPTNNNIIRQYINFELLFYIYQNNFILWDFYIMKYLSTIKNFRLFFEQLYSIPKKMNISLFLTQPKIKKLLAKNSELLSIITSPISEKKIKKNILSEKNIKFINKLESPKINKKFETSRTKIYTTSNLNNFKNEINNLNNFNKNRYSKQIEYKMNNTLNKSNNKSENNSSNIDTPINNHSTFNRIFIQKGLLFIASYIDNKRKISNEFSIHFNVDQLRKFQIMEVIQDKMTFFLKFMSVNYDTESISFDFDSFKNFNETNWVTEIQKYNFNYINQHTPLSEEKILDEYGKELNMIKIFLGLRPHVQIKVEMKCPLIIMQDLDDFGFKYTEGINVDTNIEKNLSKLKIKNTLDLTKKLIDVLKDNNFCRKIVDMNVNRDFKKKTTKKRLGNIKDNKLTTRKQTSTLGIITDSKED